MFLKDVCNRTVVVVDPETSILDAAQVMRAHHAGNVIVVEKSAEEARPVGIVTDRDIVLAVVARDVSPSGVTAGDVMGSDLLIGKESDSVWEAIRRMRLKGVRRLPVVNGRGGLTGIFTLDDALDLLSEEMGNLAKIIQHEQLQEREIRV